MTYDRPRRALRFLWRLVVLTPFVGTIAAACALPFAGRLLIVTEPLEPADAIVVLAGSRASRWMEAVDLFNDRIAPVVLLSSGYTEPAEIQLNQRGVNLQREGDVARTAMIQLGVPAAAIEVFGPAIDNTAAEASVARGIAEERGWKRLLVVTANYHTRRSRFAFARAFRDSDIQVRVRGTRYERISPETWWRHRYDARWVNMEAPKLLAYALGVGR